MDQQNPPGRALETITTVSTKQAGPRSVQTVPSAISAFGETKLDDILSEDLTDIGHYIPNVRMASVNTFSSFPNFFIRGVGVNGSTRTVDPAVGTFVDGIYIGFGPYSLVDTFDLEAVEVLRGPQGTLFGRNVTGGAVLVRSRKPDTSDFWIDGKVTIGNYSRIDLSAAVNIPVVTDKLAFKLSAQSKDRDGYYKVENLDITKADQNLVILRPMLLFTPNDDLEISIIGEYLRDKGGSAGSRIRVDNINPRLAQTVWGYYPPEDRWTVNHDLEGGVDSVAWHIIGEVNYDVGVGVITSVTGYRDVRYDSDTDFDGTPYPILHFPDNKESQDQFSQELRFASTFSEVFEFVFGLYYFEQSLSIGERRSVKATPASTTLDIAGLTLLEHKNYSAFLQGDVHFSERWTLTLGGRYTSEKKRIAFSPPGTCMLDFTGCSVAFNDDKKWDNFSPKVGIKFAPTNDTIIYASWTKGFRSGTYNARAQSADTIGPANEENVETWEIGAKNTFFDDRLLFNLTFFYSDYTNIQQIVNNPTPDRGSEQVLLNAADATIWGIELEFDAVLGGGLSIDGSFGYLDAGYDRFENFDTNGDGVVTPSDEEIALGLKLVKVPKWTFHIAGQFETPIGNAGNGMIRVSYSRQASEEGGVRNEPWLFQKAYGLLDASISYADARDRFKITVFGKNLTDNEYITFPSDAGPLFTGAWGGKPRTYGVEISFSL